MVGLLLALVEASCAAQGAGGLAVSESYLVISFADGLSGTSALGLPALSARGLRGVAWIPTAEVGEPDHMTLPELEALAAAGWDIASHLDTGGDCTQMPPDELYSRLVASHDWLVQHGFVQGARIFGPPAQKWAPELTPLATGAGHQVILVRKQKGGIVPLGLTLVYKGCASRVPLDEIAAAIQLAQSTPGKLLVLSFHDVVASYPVGTEADAERLETVLNLAVASGLPIVTVSDLMSIGAFDDE